MKYCKQCGVLYSSILEVCPKCGAELYKPKEGELPEATPGQKRRQWISLIIGIPAFIAFIYMIALVFKQLGAS